MSTESEDTQQTASRAMQQFTNYKKRRELWGQALINDRNALGMTQTQFAEALSNSDYLKDVKQQAVARWEAGATPRKETYEGLRKYLTVKFANIEKQSETLAIDLALTPDEMPGFSYVSDPRNPEPQYTKEEVRDYMEELQADTGLKYLVTIALQTEYSTEAFENYWNNTPTGRIDRWYKTAKELADPIHTPLNESERRKLLGTHQTQGQVLENLLRVYLPEHLRKNLAVYVSRGINERRYDYFSNKVVAEFKYLPEHRSPSFAISQYAPEIVALKLAETLAFGQKKIYALFLIHANSSSHEDFNPRVHSLVADCAALGIHLILVNSANSVVSFITRYEDGNKPEM